MKLTNTIRDAFVRAAMQDVPSVDYDEQIRELASKDLIDQLPPKVRAVWDDEKLRAYVKTTYDTYGGVSISYPADSDYDRNAKALTAKVATKVADLKAQHDAQSKVRRDLKDKLHATAYGCTTRKQLAELLPEFEKYLPADDVKAKAVMLPAVANIVSDFVKAGWPKKEKK